MKVSNNVVNVLINISLALQKMKALNVLKIRRTWKNLIVNVKMDFMMTLKMKPVVNANILVEIANLKQNA